MEKLAKKVQQVLGENLVAVYSYEQSTGVFVPLLLVYGMDFVEMDTLKQYFEGSLLIVLTRDDVMQGQDVFAFKFLHMLKHAELLVGEDILLSVHIGKKHLRAGVEFELRSKLIQLREAYLSSGSKDFLHQIFPVMIPLWEALLVLVDHEMATDEDLTLEALIEAASRVCACKVDVFHYILDIKKIDKESIGAIIQAINDHLLVLQDFVQKM